jgi:glucose-6-phosphate 1-dehydrogenase
LSAARGAEFNTDHIDEDAWARLADKMAYISGDLTKPDLYEKLRAALDEAEKAHGTRGNAIFYLAVADRLFGTVVEQLGKAKLTDQGEDQKRGIVLDMDSETVEHPFGTIKARMGATHFLMKTLPRVASEMALHVLAYNLTRVMNIMGTQPLMTAMRA